MAIFVKICCRDEKDVKILPGNILSEGKKMRTSSEIVLQFWSPSRYIDYSLQRVGNTIYAVCFGASVLDTLCSLPGSIRQEKEPRFQITFKMAAMFDREILYPLYASRLAK